MPTTTSISSIFSVVLIVLLWMSLNGVALGSPPTSTTLLPLLVRRDTSTNVIVRVSSTHAIEVLDVYTAQTALGGAVHGSTSKHRGSSSLPIIYVAPTLGAFLGEYPSYEQMRCNYSINTIIATSPSQGSGSTTSSRHHEGGNSARTTPNICWDVKSRFNTAVEAQLQATLRQLYYTMVLPTSSSSDGDQQPHVSAMWRVYLLAADEVTRSSLQASLAPVHQHRGRPTTSTLSGEQRHRDPRIHCTTPRCLTRIVSSLRRLLRVLVSTLTTPHQPEAVALIEMLVDAIQVLQRPTAVKQLVAWVPNLTIKVKSSLPDRKAAVVVVVLVPYPKTAASSTSAGAAASCPTVSYAQLSAILDFHSHKTTSGGIGSEYEFSLIKGANLLSTAVLENRMTDLDGDTHLLSSSISSSSHPLLVPGGHGSRHLICAVSIASEGGPSNAQGIDQLSSSHAIKMMPMGEMHVTGVSHASLLTPTFYDPISSLNYYSNNDTTTTSPVLLTLPSFPILVLLRGISLPPSYPRIVRALDFSKSKRQSNTHPQAPSSPFTLEDPSYKILLVRQSYVDGVSSGTQLDPCEVNPYTGKPIVVAGGQAGGNEEATTSRKGRGPHPDTIPLSVILPHTNAASNKKQNGKRVGQHQEGVYDPMPSAHTIFPSKVVKASVSDDEDDEALLMLEHREQRQFAGAFQLWYCGYARLKQDANTTAPKRSSSLPTAPESRTLLSQPLGRGARVVVAAPVEVSCLQDALLQQTNPTATHKTINKGVLRSFDVSQCTGAGQRAVVKLDTSDECDASSPSAPPPTTANSSSSVPHMFLSVSPLFLVDIQRYQQHALQGISTLTDDSSRFAVQRVVSFVQEVLAFRRELYDLIGMSELELSIPLTNTPYTSTSCILLAFETSRLPNSFNTQLEEDMDLLCIEKGGVGGGTISKEQREHLRSKYLALEVKSRAIVEGGGAGLMLRSSIRYHPLPVSVQRPETFGPSSSLLPQKFLLDVAHALLLSDPSHSPPPPLHAVDEDGDAVEDLSSSSLDDDRAGVVPPPSPTTPLSETAVVVPYKALLRRRSSQLHSIAEPITSGTLIVRDARYTLVSVRATCNYEGCQKVEGTDEASPPSTISDSKLRSSSTPRPQHHGSSFSGSVPVAGANYPHIRLDHPNATSIDQRIPMLFVGVPAYKVPIEGSLIDVDVSFTRPTIQRHPPHNYPTSSSSLSKECCSKGSITSPLLSCKVVIPEDQTVRTTKFVEAFQVCPCHHTDHPSSVLVVRVQVNTSQHYHQYNTLLPDGRVSAALGDYTIQCSERVSSEEYAPSSSSDDLSLLLRLWSLRWYTKFVHSYTNYLASYAQSPPKCRSHLPRLPPIDRLTSNTTATLPSILMPLFLTLPKSILLPPSPSSKCMMGECCDGLPKTRSLLANLLPFPSAMNVGYRNILPLQPAVLLRSPSVTSLPTGYTMMGLLFKEYTSSQHRIHSPSPLLTEDIDGGGDDVLAVSMVLPPSLMWALNQPKGSSAALTTSISIDTCLTESLDSCICVVEGTLEEPKDEKEAMHWRRNVRFPVSSVLSLLERAIPYITAHVWAYRDPTTLVSSAPMPLLQTIFEGGGGKPRMFHGPLLLARFSATSVTTTTSSSHTTTVGDAVVMISTVAQTPPHLVTSSAAVVSRVTRGSKWVVRIRFPLLSTSTVVPPHLDRILSLCTISEEEQIRRDTARLLANAGPAYADPLHGLEPFVPGDVADAVKNAPLPATVASSLCKVQIQQTAYINHSAATGAVMPRGRGDAARPLSTASTVECSQVKEGKSTFLDCQSEVIAIVSDSKLKGIEPHIGEVFLRVGGDPKMPQQQPEKHLFRFSARHAVVVSSQRRHGAGDNDGDSTAVSEAALVDGYHLLILGEGDSTSSPPQLLSHTADRSTNTNKPSIDTAATSQPLIVKTRVSIDSEPVVYAGSIPSVLLPAPPPPGFEVKAIFGEFKDNNKNSGGGGWGDWRQLSGDLSSLDVAPTHMLFLAPHTLSSTHRSPSTHHYQGGSLRLLHRPHASTHRRVLNSTTSATPNSGGNDNEGGAVSTESTLSVVVRNESQTYLVAIPHWWLYSRSDGIRSTKRSSVGGRGGISSFEELTAVLERSSVCALIGSDDLKALDRLLFDKDGDHQHTNRLDAHRQDALRAAGVLHHTDPQTPPTNSRVGRRTTPPNRRNRDDDHHRYPFHIAELVPKGTAEEMARVGAASIGGVSARITSHNVGVDPTPASHLVDMKDRLGVWVIPTTTSATTHSSNLPSLSGQFTACLFKRTITINTTVSTTNTTQSTPTATAPNRIKVLVSQSVDMGYVMQEAGRSAVPGARDTSPLSTLLPTSPKDDSGDDGGVGRDGSPPPSGITSSSTTTTSSVQVGEEEDTPSTSRSHPTTHIHTRPCDLVTISLVIPAGTVGDYIHRGITFLQLSDDDDTGVSGQNLRDLSAHDFIDADVDSSRRDGYSPGGVVKVLRRNLDYITLNPLTYEEAMTSIPLAPSTVTPDGSSSTEYVQATLGVATVQVKFFVTGRFAVAFRREVLNGTTTSGSISSSTASGPYASDILLRHSSSRRATHTRSPSSAPSSQHHHHVLSEGWVSVSDLHLVHAIEYSSAISAAYHRSLTSGSVVATSRGGHRGGGAHVRTNLDEVTDRVQTDLQERKNRIRAMLERQNSGSSDAEVSGLTWLLRTLRRPPPILSPTRTTAALPSSTMSGGPTLSHEGVQLPPAMQSHSGDSSSWRALFPTKGLHGSPPPTLADLQSVTVVHVTAPSPGSSTTSNTNVDVDVGDTSSYEGAPPVGPHVHPPKMLSDSVHIRWADDDDQHRERSGKKTHLIKVSVDVCASLPSVEASRRWLLSHISPSSQLRYFDIDSALSANSSPWYDALPDSAASALVWSNRSNIDTRSSSRSGNVPSSLTTPMWQSTSPSNFLERCVIPGAHVVRPPPTSSSSRQPRRQPATTSAVPLGRWLLTGGGSQKGSATLGVGVVVSKRRYPVSFTKLASLLPIEAFSQNNPTATNSDSVPIAGRDVVGVADEGGEEGGVGLRLDGSVLLRGRNYDEGSESPKERSTTEIAEDRLKHLAASNSHRSSYDAILHTCLVGDDAETSPDSSSSSVLSSLSKIARLTEFNSLVDGSTDSATAAVVDVHTLVFTVRVNADGDQEDADRSPTEALIRWVEMGNIHQNRAGRTSASSSTPSSSQIVPTRLSIVGGILNTTFAMMMSPKELLETILRSRSPNCHETPSLQPPPPRREGRSTRQRAVREKEVFVEGSIWAASVPVIGHIELIPPL